MTARADLRAASSPKVGAKSRFGPNPGLNFKPYHANVLTDRGKFPFCARTRHDFVKTLHETRPVLLTLGSLFRDQDSSI